MTYIWLDTISTIFCNNMEFWLTFAPRSFFLGRVLNRNVRLHTDAESWGFCEDQLFSLAGARWCTDVPVWRVQQAGDKKCGRPAFLLCLFVNCEIIGYPDTALKTLKNRGVGGPAGMWFPTCNYLADNLHSQVFPPWWRYCSSCGCVLKWFEKPPKFIGVIL